MSRGAGGRVRLGIIGLGAVAQAVHLPLLSRHRDRFERAFNTLVVQPREAIPRINFGSE